MSDLFLNAYLLIIRHDELDIRLYYIFQKSKENFNTEKKVGVEAAVF